MGDLAPNIQLDVLFKRNQNKSSTSLQKNSFEEIEAPASRDPVYHHLQLYTQSHSIPVIAPGDLQTVEADYADIDDLGLPVTGSYFGRTSVTAPIIRKFVQLPLVPVPSNTGAAFQAPGAITCTFSPAFSVGEVLTGQTSGARVVVISVSQNIVFWKAIVGIQIPFQQGEQLIGQTSGAVAYVQQPARTCPYHVVLKHVIPYDYDNETGSYNYKLYTAAGQTIIFGNGSWLLDVASGVLTFYGTLPTGVSIKQPPMITCYTYVGKIGLNTVHSPNGNVGISTETPQVSLDIRNTDAVGLPAGSTAQRPQGVAGYIRYNIDNKAFEGFSQGTWSPLGASTQTESLTTGSITGNSVSIVGSGSIGSNLYVNGTVVGQTGSFSGLSTGTLNSLVAVASTLTVMNVLNAASFTALSGSIAGLLQMGTLTGVQGSFSTLTTGSINALWALISSLSASSANISTSLTAATIITTQLNALAGYLTTLTTTYGSIQNLQAGTVGAGAGSFSGSLIASTGSFTQIAAENLTAATGSISGEFHAGSVLAQYGSFTLGLVGKDANFTGTVSALMVNGTLGSFVNVLTGTVTAIAASVTKLFTTGTVVAGSLSAIIASLTTLQAGNFLTSNASITGSLVAQTFLAQSGSVVNLQVSTLTGKAASLSGLLQGGTIQGLQVLGTSGSFLSVQAGSVLAAYGSFSGNIFANSITAQSITGTFLNILNATVSTLSGDTASLSGDIYGGGGLIIAQPGSFLDDVSVNGSLSVQGGVSVQGPMTVNEDMIVAGGLAATSLQILDSGSFGGSLTVGGAISALIGVPTSQTNYGPSNFANLRDSDYISDALLKLNNALQTIETQVTNQVSSGGTTSQVGSILSVGTLYSTALSVNNYASIGGDLGINGNVVASGNFTVQGTFTAKQTVYDLLTARNANISGSVSAGTLAALIASITGSLTATSIRIASNSSFLSGLSVGGQLQAGSGSVTGILTAGTLQARQGSFTTLSAANALMNSGSIQQLTLGTAVGFTGSFASQVQTATLTSDFGSFLTINVTQNITGVNGSFSGTITAAAIQTPAALLDTVTAGTLNTINAHVSNNLDVGSQVSAAYGSLSTLTTGDFQAAGSGSVAGDLTVSQKVSAQSAEISGTISAYAIDTGSLYAALGSFAGSLFGQTVQASVGTFTTVKASTSSAAYGSMGNLLAASASVTGSLGVNVVQAQSASVTRSLIVGASVTATSMSLTGSLQASSGELSGNLKVTQQIQAASVTAEVGSFTNVLVDSNIAASSITAGSISTVWINAGTTTSSYGSFVSVQATQVQSDALRTADLTVLNSGSFPGTLSANQGQFSTVLADSAQITNNLAVNGTVSASMTSFVKLQAQDGSLSSLLVGSVTASGTVFARAGSFSGSLMSTVLIANTVTGSTGSFTNFSTATLTSGRQIVQGNLSVASVATLGTVLSSLAIINTASVSNNINVIGTVVSAFADISSMLRTSSLTASSGSISNSLQAGSILMQYASVTGNADIGSTVRTGTVVAGVGEFSSSLTAQSVFATSAQIKEMLETGTIQAIQATITSTIFTGTIQTTVGSASSFQMASLVTDSAQITTGSFKTLYGLAGSLTELTVSNLYGSQAYILGSLTAASGSFSNHLYASVASLTALQSTTVTVNTAFISTLTSTTLTSLYGSITSLTSNQFLSDTGSVTGDLYVGGNMIIQGTLTQVHMTASETTMLHVDNVGTGPGLYVVQTGGTSVADFYSGTNLVTSIRPDGLQASTISAQVASLSDLVTGYASLTNATVSTLSAGPTSIAGNLTVTGTTTFDGPVHFSGTHLDRIGTPTLAPDYGQPNYLGLTAADLISDAIYKINRELGITHLPPPGGLCSLWKAELCITSATLTACFAGTSSLTNRLICNAQPACFPLANLYDGADGTLTALLNSNGSETCIGRLVMNNVPLHLGTCSQDLHVWNKQDFYSTYADLAGKWYAFSCQIGTLSSALTPGSTLYSLRLAHTRSGCTNAVEFYVDDSVEPNFVTTPEVSFGTQVTWLSGVQTFNTLTTVSAACHVSGCIQSFYYFEYGLARLSGTIICDVTEASRPGRLVDTYTPGSDQTFTLLTHFNNNVYSESATILVQAFNAAGKSSDIIIDTVSGRGLRIDTQGRPSDAQVTSGSGFSPMLLGQDFGMPYDHTQSLLFNEELQFINGRYDVPLSIDFSLSAPAGSPDYTHVNDTVSFRYATFKFSLQENTSRCTIVFVDQLGEGWGSDYTPASEMSLQIRIIDNDCRADSGWLNANAVYDGVDYRNGCLLARCTTGSNKQITFGRSLSGDAYVRVGLLCHAPVHEKAFRNVKLVTEPHTRRLLNLGDKALLLADATYEAFITGTDVLVSGMLVNTRPSTCPCYNFYDGNSGILSASMSHDGGLTFQQVGSLDLSRVPIYQEQVNEFLVLLDKADYFSDVPANKGKVFSATAKIAPTYDLAAGTASHMFDLTHSKTGSAQRVHFYVDQPLTPNVSSLSLVLQGPTRYLSGVNVYAAGANVTVTFIAHNCISYFYNASFGLAELTGSAVERTLERDQVDRNPHMFLPYAPQSLTLSTKILGNIYTERAVFYLKVFNSIGESTMVELDGVGLADLPIRVDTVSETCPHQVTSGAGKYPSLAGVDFGLDYDHEESLMHNCELQLLNGAYKVPALVNYSLYSLSSVDYTKVNDKTEWRYATFTTHFSTPASGACIRLYGLEGSGWGSSSTLASEVSINLRIIAIDDCCPHDSGWMDCNELYDGITVPQGDGAPCLLTHGTRDDCKRITFGTERYGTIYVRIGLQCRNTQGDKAFRMVKVRPLAGPAKPICDITLQPAVPLMPAYIAGTDTPIYDLCADLNMSTREMYDVIVASRSKMTAEVCQDGKWNVTGTIDLAELRNGSGTCSGQLLIINKEVSSCSKKAFIDCQITNQTFAPGHKSYAYRLRSEASRHDSCHISKPLTFHVDQYISPMFTRNPVSAVTGDFYSVSGVVTPADTATITATASVFGAVSYFYNHEHGLARLQGAAIIGQDEKTGSGDPVQYVPFGTHTVSINTQFSKNTITEDGAPQFVVYNVYGSYVTQISGVSSGQLIHVDTLSVLAVNQVSSGKGKAPTVFGEVYDHSVSLSTNEELQLYGNLYQLPLSRDFSASYPQGSPDYRDINSGLDYRYATFVYSLKTTSQKLVIRFFGQEGSAWRTQHMDNISLQLRIVGKCDSGWLNCLTPFDGINGMLLATSTVEEKYVKLPFPSAGTVYLRIGLSCTKSKDVKFRHISLLPVMDTDPVWLRDVALQLASPVVSAVLAGGTSRSFIDTLSLTDRPYTSPIYSLRLRKIVGALQAVLTQGTTSTLVGKLDLETVAEGQVVKAGFITSLGSSSHRHCNVLLQNIMLQADRIIAASQLPYYLSLQHSLDHSHVHPIYSGKPVKLYIDNPVNPEFISVSPMQISGATRQVSGVISCSTQTCVGVSGSIAGAVSMFYNAEHGIASLHGSAINTQDEIDMPLKDSVNYGSKSTVSVFLSSFVSIGYVTDASIFLTAWNSHGASLTQRLQLPSGRPIYIDTLSRIPPNQVTSGSGPCPDEPGVDFGSPYDHSQSLNYNQELQLVGGLYCIPLAVDFSVKYPPGSEDYSQTAKIVEYRYATFVYPLATNTQRLVIRLAGQQGEGWQSLADTTLQLRVVGTCDTGWLNCLTRFDGVNGILLATSTVDEKFVHLPHPCSGQVYLRIGLHSTSAMKFRHITVLPVLNSGPVMLSEISFELASPVVSAVIAGGTLSVDNLILTNRPSTLPVYSLLLKGDGSLQAELTQGTISTLVGSMNIATIADCEMIQAGFITNLGSNKQLNAVLQNIVLKADRAIPASQLQYQLNLQHLHPEEDDVCCLQQIDVAKPVRFFIDNPVNPEIVNVSPMQISGPTRQVSGVVSCSTQTCVGVSGNIAGAVSMFYNADHGIATLHGSSINTQDEIDVPSRDPVKYVPQGTVSVFLSSLVSIGYDVDASIFLTAWNSHGASCTQRLQLPGGPSIYIDTLSKIPPNQVTSGSGPEPDRPGIDFGMPYDHSQSLNNNQELQLVGGFYRSPVADDYSVKYPSGSHDYSQTAKTTEYRYATFVYPLATNTQRLVIRFAGQEGQGWQSLADTSLQLRVVGRCGSGWLDCLTRFDGINGMMLSTSTMSEKFVHLPHPCCGKVYLRIGLRCSPDSGMKFRHVTVLPVFNTAPATLMDTAFELASPVVSAVVAGGTLSVDNLLLTNRPYTLPVYNLHLKGSGVLQAELTQGTVSTSVGRLNLANTADCEVAQAGFITSLGSSKRLNAVLQNIVLEADREVPASQLPYQLNVQYLHPTGEHNDIHVMQVALNLKFHVDSPVLPKFVNAPAMQVFGPTRLVSGVVSCSTQTCVTVSGEIAGAVSYFYNPKGIATLHGSVINVQNEIDMPSRNPANYVKDANIRVELSSLITIGYDANAAFYLTAWNSHGESVSEQLASRSVYVDTLSPILPNQVTSGSGKKPDRPGIDFGLPYDHSQSLNNNQELQLVGGFYRVPVAADYSEKYPPGSEDYSQTAKMSEYRYATFVFDIGQFVSHVTIVFGEQRGSGWGGCTKTMQGASLQLRVISSECDTQWLDCNEIFDGQQGMLVGASTSASRKHVTLGLCFCGKAYVRVGLACNDNHFKQFAKLELLPNCPNSI